MYWCLRSSSRKRQLEYYQSKKEERKRNILSVRRTVKVCEALASHSSVRLHICRYKEQRLWGIVSCSQRAVVTERKARRETAAQQNDINNTGNKKHFTRGGKVNYPSHFHFVYFCVMWVNLNWFYLRFYDMGTANLSEINQKAIGNDSSIT